LLSTCVQQKALFMKTKLIKLGTLAFLLVFVSFTAGCMGPDGSSMTSGCFGGIRFCSTTTVITRPTYTGDVPCLSNQHIDSNGNVYYSLNGRNVYFTGEQNYSGSYWSGGGSSWGSSGDNCGATYYGQGDGRSNAGFPRALHSR
jgi:hypothetical protein